MNHLVISGQLIERKQLRYTPAGVPVSEGWLQHASSQMEANVERQVKLEIPLLALGENSRWLESAPIGGQLQISGFLAAKSLKSKTPVLHVNSIEFLEGNENGSILQEEG